MYIVWDTKAYRFNVEICVACTTTTMMMMIIIIRSCSIVNKNGKSKRVTKEIKRSENKTAKNKNTNERTSHLIIIVDRQWTIHPKYSNCFASEMVSFSNIVWMLWKIDNWKMMCAPFNSCKWIVHAKPECPVLWCDCLHSQCIIIKTNCEWIEYVERTQFYEVEQNDREKKKHTNILGLVCVRMCEWVSVFRIGMVFIG